MIKSETTEREIEKEEFPSMININELRGGINTLRATMIMMQQTIDRIRETQGAEASKILNLQAALDNLSKIVYNLKTDMEAEFKKLGDDTAELRYRLEDVEGHLGI